MKVLVDECLPCPLCDYLSGHNFRTVQQQGWEGVKNGALLTLAEGDFEVFLTADKNLQYQQNLARRKLAIVLLPTNHWPTLRQHIPEVQAALDAVSSTGFSVVAWT